MTRQICIYNACPSRKFVVLKTVLSFAFSSVGLHDNFMCKEMHTKCLGIHCLNCIQASVTRYCLQLHESSGHVYAVVMLEACI